MRVHRQTNKGMYFGQVYRKDIRKWVRVTGFCFTAVGAWFALRKWRNAKIDKEIFGESALFEG